MTDTKVGVESVRERIIRQIVRNCKAMEPPTYSVTWRHVGREPLEGLQSVIGDSLGIYDVSGVPQYQVGRILDTVRVVFEFWYKMKAGDVASIELNRMLADLKKLILSNHSLIEEGTGLQLIERFTLLSDEFDIEGPSDEFVSGFLTVNVLYRYSSTDPYILR